MSFDLPEIQLDPRNEYELWEQACDHAYNVSGGMLRNFSPGDPLAFLIEAQVYAGAELLWYVNKLPSKLLLAWLSQWGVSVNEGSTATGQLVINFSGPLPGPSSIPAGSLFSNGEVQYRSTQTTIAPSGSETVTINVEAVEQGSAGNSQAFTVTLINSPIAFTRNCYNPAAIAGGTDPVTPEDAIREFVRTPLDKQIISLADLERASTEYLGQGWISRAIPNFNPVLGSSELGSIALMVDNLGYEQIPVSILDGLQNHLANIAPLNVSPWVSPFLRVKVRVKIEVTVPTGIEPGLVAENLYTEILRDLPDLQAIDQERVHPMVYRSGGGLRSLAINGQPAMVINRNQIIAPEYLEITTVRDGISQVFIYGNGDPD